MPICNKLTLLTIGFLILAQISSAGVTIAYKYCAEHKVNLRIMAAYRFMFSSILLILGAIIFEKYAIYLSLFFLGYQIVNSISISYYDFNLIIDKN